MAGENRNIITQPDLTSKEVILPFHALLSLLRQNGFAIKPDDYIEILKIIEKFTSDNIKDIGPLICPLIATSPEEQEKFYKVFKQYSYTATQPILPLPPPSYKRWLLVLAVVAAFLLVYYFITNNKQHKISADFNFTLQPQYRAGDTIEVNASPVFSAKPSDSNKVTFLWNFNKDWTTGAPIQQIVLQQGVFIIQLKIRSDAIPVKDSLKSDTLYVCPASPRITFNIPAKNEYFIGDSVIINATYPGTKSPFDKTFWKVNGDTLNYNQSSLHYKFKAAGNYSINFEGLDNTDARCAVNTYLSDYNLTVNDKNEKSYALVVTPSGDTISPQKDTSLNSFVNWLFILPSLVILLGTFLWWKRKKTRPDEQQKTDPLQFEGKKPPYDTPFENKDLQLVNRENVFNEVFRSFRQKAEDEIAIFNVPKTIRSTIHSGGFPEFVFTNRLRYNDYLILIDRTIANNQQTKLFNYLVSVFNEEAIIIDRFYYQGSLDKLTNEEYPEGLSLKRLSELYKQHTLIIMGNAWQLVYDAYPVLEKKILEILHEWEYKAILTPVSYKDWTQKEDLIRQQLILIPADIQGQIKLIQAIREHQLNHEKYLCSIEEFYETQTYDFESPEELKNYLGDEVLFQWLCAICVFHKLHWEIVVEMGKAICNRYAQPEKMTYTSLLKLARISWMQEGVFPGITRMELLKRLAPENEIIARETLLRMLEYSDTYFGKGYFFEEEKEIQKITNRFVLFAHDHDKYQQFQPEQERFKALWEHDQLRDTPQKTYLDKHDGDNWSTLIEHDGKSVGINDYLNQQWIKKLQQFKKVLWRNGIIAASLLVILGCLHLFKNKLPSTPGFPLVTTEDIVSYTFLLNDSVVCTNQNGKGEAIQSVSGTVMLADSTYRLNFSRTGQNKWASHASATHKNILDTSGRLAITWNNGKEDQSLAANVVLTKQTLETAITGCEVALVPGRPLYVHISAATDSNGIENQLKAALKRYDISITREDFKGPSHIIYYEEAQKTMADSVTQTIKQSMGIDVKTEFMRENRTPPAVPILYLNPVSTTCNTIAISALPQNLNEIWHGGTSNRLINIDLPKKVIYYSTGDKKTFGTYQMDEACFTNGTYRIITKANSQYQVFLFRDAQPSSFELSVCQNRYNTKAEAQAINESYCDRFNKMSWYYEANADLVFVPKDARSYVATERRKAFAILDSINKKKATADAYIFVNNINNVSMTSADIINRQNAIKASTLLKSDAIKYGVTRNNNNFYGTPFDRDYIRIDIKPAEAIIPPTIQADCSKTFSSLKEALSVKAEVICKLNLSNQYLYAIPKEVYTFKNLQELDLRGNSIPESDIQQLQKQLPKCKILYDSTERPVKDTTAYLLYTVEFDNKNYPAKDADIFIPRLGQLLKSYPDYKVKLVAAYTDVKDMRNTNNRLNILKNMLQKNGAGANQLQTQIIKSEINYQQQQEQKQKVPPESSASILIYGIGFKEVPRPGYDKAK